ncbi:hypothetical protein FQN54_000870 [Arachnomyces sp. PD_36]|nr:hypothetical protein FQN54_000870 [Arachnomyces sp. PD_36]
MFRVSSLPLLCLGLLLPCYYCSSLDANDSLFSNPILLGWNPDPSCTLAPEWDNTTFCTTSSFLTFPGIPIYASKDLAHWKFASHALSRPEQLPELSNNGQQNDGVWASTFRFRDGTFYLITSYVAMDDSEPIILLFTTTDPFDDTAWSDPLRVENPANDIDPDIFWDDDGKVYMTVASGMYISEIDLTTGEAGEPFTVWNGTGGRNPEAPHLYKKDDFYYLLISEGGTETNHSATIARSKDIRGPYEGCPDNPILTAKNTDNFFQTVGHADLFTDSDGNWWAVALSTRSGPEWEFYPMGRETVLLSVTWEKGGWPILDEADGGGEGPLPQVGVEPPGNGPLVDVSEDLEFPAGSEIPKQFVFWRPPKESLFAISPPGHPKTLQISPSRVNLTGDAAFEPSVDGLGFVARRQTASTFDFSVDVAFNPTEAYEECGVSIFLTQLQHIDLGVVMLPDQSNNNTLVPMLRLRAEASGKPGTPVPETKLVPIPSPWMEDKIRFFVTATTDSRYIFSAGPATMPWKEERMGSASAAIVSGGSGPFTGTLVGVYATSNGGEGTTPAFFSRWRYNMVSQELSDNGFVPADG